MHSFLFEFVPPIGKGANRISVRIARLNNEVEARKQAAVLLAEYPVEKIRIFKVGPRGESFHVATLPEEASASASE